MNKFGELIFHYNEQGSTGRETIAEWLNRMHRKGYAIKDWKMQQIEDGVILLVVEWKK